MFINNSEQCFVEKWWQLPTWYDEKEQRNLSKILKNKEVNLTYVFYKLGLKLGWKERHKKFNIFVWVTSSRCICSVNVNLLILRLIKRHKWLYNHLSITFTTIYFGW